MIDKRIDPNYKEKVLNISILAPFILLIATPEVDKVHVWFAYIAVGMWYSLARIIYKMKTGQWKW